MPYEKAVDMIESNSNKDCLSVINSKIISRLIYDTFPNLDEEFLTQLCIFHSEKGIIVELSNLFGYFSFTSNTRGEVAYYQCMRGESDNIWRQIYQSLPDKKEIIKHIKRKRIPRSIMS